MPVTETILLNLAIRVGVKLAGSAAKYLQIPLVEAAIRETAEEFPQVEVAFSLRAWVDSPRFAAALARLSTGARDGVDSELVASFLESGFDLPDNRDAEARRVLETFFQKVVNGLYRSADGLVSFSARFEVAHLETSERLSTLIGEVRALKQSPAIVDSPAPRESADEQALSVRVDEYKRLIELGKPSTAKSLLESLRSDSAFQSTTDHIKYRVLANLGACAIALDENDSAVELMTQALAHKPESADGEANLATAWFVASNFDESERWASAALRRDPEHDQARSILIQSLNRSPARHQELSRIASELRSPHGPSTELALAIHDLDLGDATSALARARLVEASGQRTFQARVLVAAALAQVAQGELQREKPLEWRSSDRLRDLLREALAAYGQIVADTIHYESSSYRVDALISRAAIAINLSDYAAARADLNSALAAEPTSEAALRNLAALENALGNHEAALRAIQAIPGWKDRRELALEAARALLSVRRAADARSLVEPYWSAGGADRPQLQAAEILLIASRELGDPSLGNAIQDWLETQIDDPEAALVLGEHRSLIERHTEAIEILEGAMARATGGVADRIRLALSDAHSRSGDNARASEALDAIVQANAAPRILERYAIRSVNGGRTAQARQAAAWLVGANASNEVGLEVEAAIAEWIGQPIEAANRRLLLASLGHRPAHNRARAASLQWLAGDDERARALLAEAISSAPSDATDLIQIGQLQALLGVGQPLETAYRASVAAPTDPAIQLAYTGVFMRRELPDAELLSPDTVAPETTVGLRRGEVVSRFWWKSDLTLLTAKLRSCSTRFLWLRPPSRA